MILDFDVTLICFVIYEFHTTVVYVTRFPVKHRELIQLLCKHWQWADPGLVQDFLGEGGSNLRGLVLTCCMT